MSISSPTTIYVNNAGGNDCNDGSTPALAYATLAAAFQLLKTYDLSAQLTFQLADSATAYPSLILPNYVGDVGYTGGYDFTFPRIQGNPTNNAAVRLSGTNIPTIIGCLSMPWSIESLKLESVGSWAIEADNQARIFTRYINFGNCTQGHMLAAYGGLIETRNDAMTGMDITGGTVNGFHMFATMGGKIYTQGNLVRTANNPSFNYFAHADNHGEVFASGYVPAPGASVTCAHPGAANVDATSIATPLSNGTWP
jgi:hypothetical protein